MKTRALFALVAAAGLASVANAQEAISFKLYFSNNSINEGGTNKVMIDVSFAPPGGSTAKWDTPPGTGQTGTVIAFAAAVLDMLNKGNAQNGTWSNLTLHGDYSQGGLLSPGTPNAGGGIDKINMGQSGPNPNNYNKDNPIVQIWAADWTGKAGFQGVVSLELNLAAGKTAKTWLKVDGVQVPVADNWTFLTNGTQSFAVESRLIFLHHQGRR
jgi:hypothetical protein